MLLHVSIDALACIIGSLLDPISPHIVLKLLPLSALKLVQLLQVCEPLCWRLKLLILTIDSFSEELFGGDLDIGGSLIFDTRWSPCGLHGSSRRCYARCYKLIE